MCPLTLIAPVKDCELIALNVLSHFSITHSSTNPNVSFPAENLHHPLSINVESMHVSETVHETGLCKLVQTSCSLWKQRSMKTNKDRSFMFPCVLGRGIFLSAVICFLAVSCSD